MAPQQLQVRWELADSLQGLGRLSEAIDEYRKAIGLKSEYPEAHNNLANARGQVGQLGEAIDEFREAIRFVAIDPAAVYAKAVTTPGLLPNATLVVDHFHLVRGANTALVVGAP